MSEKIIAVSAGREITETEFNEFLSKLPEQQQAYVATEEGRKQALTQYANYFLFEKLGYDKKYDQDEAFLATMEAVKRELLGQYALTQEIKDIQATQEECEAYYNEHKTMFVKAVSYTHLIRFHENEKWFTVFVGYFNSIIILIYGINHFCQSIISVIERCPITRVTFH